MSKSFSYTIGKAFGGLPVWGRVVVVGLIVVVLFRMCSSPSTNSSSTSGLNAASQSPAIPASNAADQAAVELAKRKAACESSLAQKRSSYDALMKEKKYWDASLQVRQCADLLADPQLLELVKDAEIKTHLAEINGAKVSLRDKARAIEMLVRDYPDVGAKYQAMLPKLLAAAEKQEATAEARRKRSEGVRIGMSKADVLASSWGKPERVNRTTNAYGTREQWVYGIGNYLYFEDDVLVSIQN